MPILITIRPAVPHRVPRRARMWTAAALAVVFLLVSAAGSMAVVLRASAALEAVVETGRPGYLVLRSSPGAPQWTALRPGDTVHWLIEASLADAVESTLSIQLHADGPLIDADAMTVSVESCTTPFQQSDGSSSGPRCDGAGETVLTDGSLSAAAGEQAEVYDLADLRRGTPRHVLVSLSVPPSADPQTVAGASARVGVGLHAEGDTPPDTALAVTGADFAGDLVALALLGGGLIGLGLSLASWRRLRQAQRETRP